MIFKSVNFRFIWMPIKSFTTTSKKNEFGSVKLEIIFKLLNIFCTPCTPITTNSNSNGCCSSYQFVGRIFLILLHILRIHAYKVYFLYFMFASICKGIKNIINIFWKSGNHVYWVIHLFKSSLSTINFNLHSIFKNKHYILFKSIIMWFYKIISNCYIFIRFF